MKPNFVVLVIALAIVSVAPAVAQTDLYENGPTNGTTDAWTINSGFIVSDSFIFNAGATVNSLVFSAWLFPGDTVSSVDVSITSSEFGGTSFFSGTVSLTSSGCTTNQFGFDLCNETGNLGSGVSLGAGTYWLNLNNAVVTNGDPVYWDENSGPSSASQNSVGTIPSESFTLEGGGCGAGGKSSPDCGPPPPQSPEPGSLLLFGSGLIAMLEAKRRFLG